MNTVVYPLYIFMYTKIAVCMFQGPSGKLMEGLYNIIPGREIPKWFEKVNICGSYVVTPPSRFTLHYKPFKTQKKWRYNCLALGLGVMGGGELFCAFFFYPASVVSTESMWLKSIRLKWMDAKWARKRSSEIGFGAELALMPVPKNTVKLNRITFGCTVCLPKLLAAQLMRRDSIKLSLK